MLFDSPCNYVIMSFLVPHNTGPSDLFIIFTKTRYSSSAVYKDIDTHGSIGPIVVSR